MPTVTLAILAGGQGTRMGCPKDRLLIDHQPILNHLTSRLSGDWELWLVCSAGRPRPIGWERFTRVVFDDEPGLGPLAGIAAAVRHATTDLTLVATLDMPLVGQAQLRWLVEQANAFTDPSGICCKASDRAGGDVEPFPAVFRPKALATVSDCLTARQLSLQKLFTKPGFVALDAPGWDPSVWTNLNRPGDGANAGIDVRIAGY